MLVGLTVSEQLGPPPPPPPVLTVTGTEHVVVCPVGLITVPTNVVSAVIAGESTEPPTAGETEPMPWSIENVLGLVDVQVSVVRSPTFTRVGDAESVQVGGGGVVVTVIVAVQVAVPPLPVAVPVYVVVVVGLTEREPAATGVTLPIPWLRVNEVALLVVQASDEELPVWMAFGVATRVHVGPAGGGGVTVIVAVQVEVPPGPVAVPRYVVVFVGLTEREPDATGVTLPMPWLMLNEEAFAVVHESVEDEPLWIVVGEAASVHTGDAGGGGSEETVIVAVQVAVPPLPVAVPV
jgi:hypothetical protein